MMLFSMLSAAQGGKSIVFLSRHFGLSNRQMTNVIRHFLPILMRGIQKNFAQQGGLTTLLKTLDRGNYGSYYDDPNIYTNPEVRNRGIMIMEQALGADDIQRKILHRIYLSTGIDPDTLQLVLPFVTTLALSTLYRKAHTQLNPSAMPTQLPYHGPGSATQTQAQQPRPQQQQQYYAQGQTAQYQAAYQQQAQPVLRQRSDRQPLPGMGQPPRQQQPQAVPAFNGQANGYNGPANGMQQPQQNHHHQMPLQGQQRPPVQQAPQQERLPNIILQAQEAHAQKQRKINKKGRLSRMLKAPFQLAQNNQSEHQQPANGYQHAEQNHQYYAGQHHSQLQHSQPNLPQQRVPDRKYVSLQEKLSAQLPWYEQTGS